MELGEGIKKLLLAGIGTAAVTAEKSKEVLDELVKKGELTVEQGKVLNQELKHNIKESVKKNVNVTLKPSNPDELKDVLNKMTPDQLAALKEQISQMQAKDVDAEGAKEEPEEAKEAEAEEAPAEEKKEEIAVIEITEEYMKDRLYEFRGKKVILDSDLAEIYGYETKNFKR